MAEGSRVKIEDMAKEIAKQLDAYSAVTADEMKEIVRSVGKDVKAYIRKNAPVRVPTESELKSGKYRKRKPGTYAGSFVVTATVDEPMESEVTVHSRNQYMLTHLLENGHAIVTGGRTKSGHYRTGKRTRSEQSYTGKVTGRVRAIPHLAQADELARNELMARLEKILKGD